MRALLGLVFLVFSVAAGAVADSYLCMADQATGFTFDKATKTWSRTNFNVSNSKYVVARSKDERYTWTVTQVGEETPIAFCKDDIRAHNQFLNCAVNDPSYYFNFKSLRYAATAAVASILITGTDEGPPTPFVEIGKCSPL
jgi:hypothetical protein